MAAAPGDNPRGGGLAKCGGVEEDRFVRYFSPLFENRDPREQDIGEEGRLMFPFD